jgi:hypothetical protein
MAMEMDLHGESRVAVGTGLVREVSLEMSGRIRSRVEVEGARRVMRMAIAGKQRVGIEPQ